MGQWERMICHQPGMNLSDLSQRCDVLSDSCWGVPIVFREPETPGGQVYCTLAMRRTDVADTLGLDLMSHIFGHLLSSTLWT